MSNKRCQQRSRPCYLGGGLSHPLTLHCSNSDTCDEAARGFNILVSIYSNHVLLEYVGGSDSRVEFAVPDGWDFEHSLTRNHNVVRNEEMAERLELIQHENGVSAYRDRTTGREVYMGRTSTGPSSSSAR